MGEYYIYLITDSKVEPRIRGMEGKPVLALPFKGFYVWYGEGKDFNECICIDVYEKNGSTIRYVVPSKYRGRLDKLKEDSNERLELVLWEDFFKKGSTNCSSGKINARNNRHSH